MLIVKRPEPKKSARLSEIQAATTGKFLLLDEPRGHYGFTFCPAHAPVHGGTDPEVRGPWEPLGGPGAGDTPVETKDSVNHPKHYTSHPSGVEAIEIAEHLGFCLGNAFKYLVRAPHKGGKEDYEKAIWYVQRARGSEPSGRFCFAPDLLKKLEVWVASELDSVRKDCVLALFAGACDWKDGCGRAIELLKKLRDGA